MAKDLVLSNQEQTFIHNLIENGGNVRQAARDAGYGSPEQYGYVLRKRLAKEIAEATQQWLAWHGPKAAHKVVAMLDDEMPNPVHLSVAKDILDRVGAKVKEEVQELHVKANIFILPEKRIEEAKIIDLEPE